MFAKNIKNKKNLNETLHKIVLQRVKGLFCYFNTYVSKYY